MEKVRPWCGQPSDRGRLKKHNRTSGTTRVSRYQKGKTNLDFTEARDSEWQWHQLGRMQVCTSLQTYNHTSTPPVSFLQAGCPPCHPTNSIKALKACVTQQIKENNQDPRTILHLLLIRVKPAMFVQPVASSVLHLLSDSSQKGR